MTAVTNTALHWSFAPLVLMEEFAEVQYCFDTKPAIFLGRRRMIYTWRLTGGYIADYFFSESKYWASPYILDICCGEMMQYFNFMQGVVKYIMSKNPRDNPFKDIPRWCDPKPYFNDQDFMNKILDLRYPAGREIL